MNDLSTYIHEQLVLLIHCMDLELIPVTAISSYSLVVLDILREPLSRLFGKQYQT